jgi:TRAP-type mannitol/chloroaromatic compound transport system permease small subunit
MWLVIKAIEAPSKVSAFIGSWLLAPLILGMVWEVFSRYVLRSPTFWAFEIAYMLMGAAFMLGIAYTLQMRRHVRVDFLYDHVSPKLQATIDLVGFIVLVLPAATLVLYGLWDYFVYAYVNGELSGQSAWNPIVWPFRTTFVIGFALVILQTVAEILKCVLVLMGHDVPRPEAME